MADQSDVEVALVNVISAALYPNGVSGGVPKTVTGQPARIFRGWPDSKALDSDLRAGVFNVSVYPRNGVERNTTRYPRTWQQQSLNATTYTLTATGSVITVGGSAPATYYPQNLAAFVSSKPYVVTAGAAQTAEQVAAALLALILVDWPSATLSGAAITLPSPAIPGAMRVGSTGTSIQEVKRQQKQFQVILWCPSPDIRDAVAEVVDAALGATDWLALPDGSAARLIYASSMINDAPEKEILYRRDLIYTAEWATTQTATDTEIVAVQENLDDQFGDLLKTTYA